MYELIATPEFVLVSICLVIIGAIAFLVMLSERDYSDTLYRIEQKRAQEKKEPWEI